MKKTILLILLLFLSFVSFSQNRKSFPHKVMLKDINGNRVSSTTFYNFDKPIIIDFWATYCKPCIQKIEFYKKQYKEWQDNYGVKIIIISVDEKRYQKDAIKITKNRKWPFQFYFDENKELLKELSKSELIPQSFIYNGNFNLQAHNNGGVITKIKDNKVIDIFLDPKYKNTLKKISVNQ
jgi:cytochrome c biogenesis protein CcmG/thiol:disulfide interchange protein DsbE